MLINISDTLAHDAHRVRDDVDCDDDERGQAS